ncbi:hypothetical protein [Brevibacillus sp. MER 51]|uniref:hypothetical protein n=1 Tax=Brevibacillus sp. MER 51 TaxID=2939560 RepID=UPI00203E8422|nr:hypothetical protein [Brevibacillus sp. MER 51]MCM3143081.1 hypothetical protein [Brevibacillus sp. MER 51]
MSIMLHKGYVQAADQLKQALANYCYEVKKAAPELSSQADQLMQSVLIQDNVIFNLLNKRKPSAHMAAEGESGK